MQKLLLSIFACLLILSGCGSSSGDGADLTRLQVSDETLATGEEARVDLDFSFDSTSVFEDGEDLKLVVKLPPSLSYKSGTAEFQGIFLDDAVAPEIQFCDTGAQILTFEAGSSDLATIQNPSGDQDGQLSLIITAVQPSQDALVQGKVSEESSFFPETCEDVFSSQATTIVRIV